MAERKSKRTRFAEVTCNVHGSVKPGRNWTSVFKQAPCPIPKTKKESQSGCPMCKGKTEQAN